MTKGAYYNENDPYAAEWLRGLIRDGLIAPGDVDDRSIIDVRPEDLAGFTQCHFFAGIGGWSYALRLAGWQDDRPAWSGSCPCQPLSGAGLRKGHADERHLWPAFYHLIAECRPASVFGEQVASKDGREWLAGVRADLEDVGYAVGAADLCSPGVGSAHIRQRLFWLADACGKDNRRRSDHRSGESAGTGEGQPLERPAGFRAAGGRVADTAAGQFSIEERGPEGGDGPRPAGAGIGGLADANGGCGGNGGIQSGGQQRQQPKDNVAADRLGDAEGQGLPVPAWQSGDAGPPGCAPPGQGPEQAGSVPILCSDGKWRRVPADAAGEPEPRLFPLAHGVPGGRMAIRRTAENGQEEIHWYSRVGTLKGAGNAINPVLAAQFIQACEEALTAP